MAIKDIIEASNRNINYGIAYRHMQLLDGMGFVKLISRRLNKYIWTITPSGRRNLGVMILSVLSRMVTSISTLPLAKPWL